MSSFIVKAQSQFDEYKYIVVPEKFDVFKQENQYQTSTLVKYLFSKRNFTTVYEGSMPKDLTANRCLGLFVNLRDDSSMFSTKTTVILEDCTGKEVFVTAEGKSKSKEFKAAYSEALRAAMNSFNGIAYKYNPLKKEEPKKEEPITVSFKNDIKTLEEKPKVDAVKGTMIKQEATIENQSYKDATPVESNFKKESEVKKEVIAPQNVDVLPHEPLTLYAQEIANGFQLVDSTPKIQYKLRKSSFPTIYITNGEDKDGIVYSKDGKWLFEYYAEGKLVIEELKIKF